MDGGNPASFEETADGPKPFFPAAASLPIQIGPHGIRYDFKHGARVLFPNRSTGKWRIRLSDLDTGNTLFLSENQDALVASGKRFFVRFGIEVGNRRHQRRHKRFYPRVRCPRPPRPNPIPGRHFGRHPGVVPLCRAFRRNASLPPHPCHVTVDHSAAAGLGSGDRLRHPRTGHRTQTRRLRLRHRQPRHGFDRSPPRIKLPDESRPIADLYVCIAVQSSSQAKY